MRRSVLCVSAALLLFLAQGSIYAAEDEPTTLSSGRAYVWTSGAVDFLKFEVTYEVGWTSGHPDQNPPSYMRVYIDGTPYEMTEISSYSPHLLVGITERTYSYTLIGTSPRTYYFEASDDSGTVVRLPESGTYSWPEVEGAGTATTLSISPSSFTVAPAELVTFTATLTANGEPLAGKTIRWSANVGSANFYPSSGTTDSSGRATTEYLPLSGGDIEVTAIFAGDNQYRASTTTATSGGAQPSGPGVAEYLPWLLLVLALIIIVSIVGLAAYLKRRRPRRARARVGRAAQAKAGRG